MKQKILNEIIEFDKSVKAVSEELSILLYKLQQDMTTDKDILVFKKLREIRKKVDEL
jgi:hypothetical protein